MAKRIRTESHFTVRKQEEDLENERNSRLLRRKFSYPQFAPI